MTAPKSPETELPPSPGPASGIGADGRTSDGPARDPELTALGVVATALEGLDAAACRRILEYLWCRYAGGSAMKSSPRRCLNCGAPENDHPYRHPFVAVVKP